MLRECRRCLLRESAEGDVFETIRQKIKALPTADKADEALYQSRLSVCKTCEQLISGVCMKCGCYVEFRAAFKTQKCPDSSKKHW